MTSLADETSSWAYRHDRDLTGFIDGSENPTLLDAAGCALLPEGVPCAAGSVLSLQKWKHKTAQWEALPTDPQERIMGHTKLNSIEFETSHRTRMSLALIRTSLGTSFHEGEPSPQGETRVLLLKNQGTHRQDIHHVVSRS